MLQSKDKWYIFVYYLISIIFEKWLCYELADKIRVRFGDTINCAHLGLNIYSISIVKEGIIKYLNWLQYLDKEGESTHFLRNGCKSIT